MQSSRCLGPIAFVPVDDFALGWNSLKLLLEQYSETASFIAYFESTWLNNPHYPIAMWSCYESTLSDNARTKNFSKGCNNAGCASPTIYRLFDILKGFNSQSELKILQTANGQDASRKLRNKTQKIKKRVNRTIKGYRHANIVAYCRSLGHLNSWTSYVVIF